MNPISFLPPVYEDGEKGLTKACFVLYEQYNINSKIILENYLYGTFSFLIGRIE